MRFKIDENLSPDIAAELRNAGYVADTCLDERISGHDDSSVFAHANADGRVLITQDLDFADIRVYAPGSHTGIVIFRLHDQKVRTTLFAIRRLIKLLAAEDISGYVIIVEDHQIRIRRPNP